MAKHSYATLVAPCLLLVLAACDRRVIREAHGKLTLVTRSWTIPGPCPKHRSDTNLYGSTGDLMLENARFVSSSPDEVWSLWTGGETGDDMFAVDQRTDTRHSITWSNRVAPQWWCPTSHRVVLVRSGNPRDRVLLIDFSSGGPEPRLNWYSDHGIDQISWSPAGDSLAVLTDLEATQGPRSRLLHIRSFAGPEVAMIEEREEAPSFLAIVWDGSRPRLEPRR